MIIKDNKYMMWLNTTEDDALNEMCRYQFVEMMQKDAKIFELYAKYIYNGSSILIESEYGVLNNIFNIENESLSRAETLLLGKALITILMFVRMKGEFTRDAEGKNVKDRITDKYLDDNEIQFYDGNDVYDGRALPLDIVDYYEWRCRKDEM